VRIERVPKVPEIGKYAYRATLAQAEGKASLLLVCCSANVFTSPEKQLVRSIQASWQVTCSMLGKSFNPV
jgi:hypothetical protein